ncbi:hypothetical protein BH10CHL1_BH10CHL1_04750 [soil metagenome]
MPEDTNHSSNFNIDANIDHSAKNIAIGQIVDQTILENVTVILGIFESTQLEGRLLENFRKQNFLAITAAINTKIREGLGVDQVSVMTFAGEILKELISKWQEKTIDEFPSLKEFLNLLIEHVGQKLTENHYWDEYSHYEPIEGATFHSSSKYEVLSLKATTNLWLKENNTKMGEQFGIVKLDGGKRYYLVHKYLLQPKFTIIDVKNYDSVKRKILIRGIILDLILLKSEYSGDVQFLDDLPNLFAKPDSK